MFYGLLIMNITQLYDEIYSLSKMRILNNFSGEFASELVFFQHECWRLLKLYNFLKQNLTEEQWLCCDYSGEKQETLSEAIKRAYHSVLFTDTMSDEDRYFFETRRCGLLDGGEYANPYRDLQAVSEGFVRKQDIRFEDFRIVFTKLRDLLKARISDDCLLEELYSALQPLETTYSKYTRQFFEQR